MVPYLVIAVPNFSEKKEPVRFAHKLWVLVSDKGCTVSGKVFQAGPQPVNSPPRIFKNMLSF